MDSKKRQLVESQLKRFFATFSANRHLSAYLIDRNPEHIAAAWRAFREHKIAPDESMLRWIDCLADSVLKPTAAKVRPRKNTVRDLAIVRAVEILQRKQIIKPPDKVRLTRTEIFANVGRAYSLSGPAVAMIVSRANLMLRDPYYEPKAFQK